MLLKRHVSNNVANPLLKIYDTYGPKEPPVEHTQAATINDDLLTCMSYLIIRFPIWSFSYQKEKTMQPSRASESGARLAKISR